MFSVSDAERSVGGQTECRLTRSDGEAPSSGLLLVVGRWFLGSLSFGGKTSCHHGPWWFSSDGSGRFDLEPPNGACYLAETPLGTLIEHFDGISVIPQEDLDERRISTLSPGRPLRLADCTSPVGRRFGIDLSLSASPDYAHTQRFAAWFHEAGLDGVRYLLRNDPAATLVGIALFNPAGEQDLPVLSTYPVDEATLAAAAQRYGIEVVPTP